MAGGDQETLKKKFDTTKMSAEELRMCNTEHARRVLGKGGSHGVQGGVSLSKARRYPAVLAGVAVLTGIGTAMYYKSVNHVQEINPGKANEAVDSIPIPDAPADAAAA